MEDRNFEDAIFKKTMCKLKTANPDMHNAMGR
jgi:hypothetical protein